MAFYLLIWTSILCEAGPEEFMAEHTLNNFLMYVLVIVMPANESQDYSATAVRANLRSRFI